MRLVPNSRIRAGPFSESNIEKYCCRAAKFGRRPCLFHNYIIGIENKLSRLI